MNQAVAPPPTRKRPRWRFLATADKPRQRVLASLIWFGVIVSYAAVTFAIFWPHDFRNSAWAYVCAARAAFMIRTFLFHLGLLLAACAIIAACIRRRLLLVTALPLVLYTVGPSLWSYVPKSRPPVASQTLTIMSVNLLAPNRLTAPIVAEVVAAKPDVLLLQEYAPHWHAAFQAALADQYPHVRSVARRDSFGLAIYSRQRFVGPVDMGIPLGTAQTPQARAVLPLGDRKVAFYNVHLMPPKGHSRTIEQRREFADLIDQLKREELPIVLCGDFNFTNASPFADELRRLGLIDAHLISGHGRGSTWPASGLWRWLPGLRLDHIFVSRELTSTHSRTGTGQGSDHRPVLAEIGLAP